MSTLLDCTVYDNTCAWYSKPPYSGFTVFPRGSTVIPLYIFAMMYYQKGDQKIVLFNTSEIINSNLGEEMTKNGTHT